MLRIFADFYRMAYAPASNADAIRFFGGGSEEGPPKTTFKQGSRRFPGHVFFELFDDFCDF